MSEQAPSSSPRADRPRRKRRWVRVLVWALVVLLVTLGLLSFAVRWVASGGLGANLAADRLEGMETGVGELRLENFDGDLLDVITVDQIQLIDQEGPWLTLRDLRLDWQPRGLLQREVHIETLEAGEVILHRTPNPAPRPEQEGGGGLPDLAFLLDNLSVDELVIEEPVIGRREVFEADASGALRRDGGGSVHLQAIETQDRADQIIVDAQFPPDGDISVEINARGEAGGLTATLLQAPEGESALLDAQAEGAPDRGAGGFALRFGGSEAASGEVEWTPDALTVQAGVAADSWAFLAPLTERAGPAADLDLTIANYRSDEPLIRAELAADRLNLSASGPLPTGDNLSTTGMDVELRLEDLGAWTGGAVAASSASFSGAVRRADGVVTADGSLSAQDVDAFTLTADAMTGPITITYADSQVGFETRLAARGAAGEADVVGRLIGAAPTLALNGAYLLDEGALVFDRLDLEQAPAALQAEARIALQGQRDMTIEGRVDSAPVSAILPAYEGTLAGDFRVNSPQPGAPMQIAAQGEITELSGLPQQAASLVGEQLTFDVEAAMTDGAITLQRAVAENEEMRAGAEGEIDFEAGYDLSFEAAVRGPLPAGPAEFAGEALARGTMTGPLDAPQIQAQVFSETLNLAGTQLQRPVIDLSLDMAGGLSGRVEARAESEYGPATAELSFAQQDGALTAPDIAVNWADIQATGGVRSAAGGALEGALSVTKTGADASPWPGSMEGEIRLSGRGGEQYVEADLQGGELAFPQQNTWIDAVSAQAAGPLSQLDFTVSGEGVVRGVPMELSSEGAFSADETGQRAEFGLNIQAGRVEIASEAPLALEFGPGGGRSMRAILNVDEGRVSLEYDAAPDGTLMALTIEDAPVAVVEATRPDPRLDGVLNAQARIDTRGGALDGEITASLTDARSMEADEEMIDADLRAQIQDGALTGTLNMRGEGGFSARAQGSLPVARADGLVPVSIRSDADLSGELTAGGPVETLTNVLLGSQQRLSGEVMLQASLSGTPADPRINGEGGLSQARFDDAVSGLSLRNLQFGADFSNDSISVSEFSATDGQGGRLTGGGGAQSEGGEWTGEVTANLSNFQVVNRDGAQATVSGEIMASAGPDGRLVQGDLQLDQGEFAPPDAAPEGVRTIQVVEINVPGREEERVVGQRREPIQLDVALDADRRLFVRSGNFNVELSLNLHIGGTASNPEITGEANVVRGDVDLANRRFTLQSGSVEFDGEPMQAAIDFTATRETADLTAIIRVTGTPQTPRITLESEPELPQDEILARVLFGRSVTDLSALEAAQLASALASMGGGGGFDALGSIRSGLGLDRLSIGQSESGDPLVSGGRYLTDDVYLEITTGAREGASAQVEWQALNDFAIISRFGSFADTSISVRWRTTY